MGIQKGGIGELPRYRPFFFSRQMLTVRVFLRPMPNVKPPKIEAPEAPMWTEAAAAMLGRLSGIARKNSQKAAEAARINGRRPCRPGKKRGRPPGQASLR